MGSVSKIANVRTETFWGELQPSEHSVQIYGSETIFMDALEGYASAGLRRGESVVLISTAAHLHELEKRLRANWLDLDRARWENRYVALLAQETLSRFMVDEMPDESLFNTVAGDILERARGVKKRRVRAFGEMVALLWKAGNCAGAIALEGLWNKVQAEEKFPLFCAYPREGFMGESSASIRSVCATHSRIIPGYA
jgi:MEDS: MEthanogen/methylotroph, DcmR Sensory domain